jgi:ubiquitin carboxyl-terminal hydrolase 22/27/51
MSQKHHLNHMMSRNKTRRLQKGGGDYEFEVEVDFPELGPIDGKSKKIKMDFVQLNTGLGTNTAFFHNFGGKITMHGENTKGLTETNYDTWFKKKDSKFMDPWKLLMLVLPVGVHRDGTIDNLKKWPILNIDFTHGDNYKYSLRRQISKKPSVDPCQNYQDYFYSNINFNDTELNNYFRQQELLFFDRIRTVRGGGNCYYISVMYGLFESIIEKKDHAKLQEVLNVIKTIKLNEKLVEELLAIPTKYLHFFGDSNAEANATKLMNDVHDNNPPFYKTFLKTELPNLIAKIENTIEFFKNNTSSSLPKWENVEQFETDFIQLSTKNNIDTATLHNTLILTLRVLLSIHANNITVQDEINNFWLEINEKLNGAYISSFTQEFKTNFVIDTDLGEGSTVSELKQITKEMHKQLIIDYIMRWGENSMSMLSLIPGDLFKINMTIVKYNAKGVSITDTDKKKNKEYNIVLHYGGSHYNLLYEKNDLSEFINAVNDKNIFKLIVHFVFFNSLHLYNDIIEKHVLFNQCLTSFLLGESYDVLINSIMFDLTWNKPTSKDAYITEKTSLRLTESTEKLFKYFCPGEIYNANTRIDENESAQRVWTISFTEQFIEKYLNKVAQDKINNVLELILNDRTYIGLIASNYTLLEHIRIKYCANIKLIAQKMKTQILSNNMTNIEISGNNKKLIFNLINPTIFLNYVVTNRDNQIEKIYNGKKYIVKYDRQKPNLNNVNIFVNSDITTEINSTGKYLCFDYHTGKALYYVCANVKIPYTTKNPEPPEYINEKKTYAESLAKFLNSNDCNCGVNVKTGDKTMSATTTTKPIAATMTTVAVTTATTATATAAAASSSSNKTTSFSLVKTTSSIPAYIFSTKGIQNVGNTCYFNSIIQCLIHTEPFINFLQKYEPNPAQQNSIFEIFKTFYNYINSASTTDPVGNNENHIFNKLIQLNSRENNTLTPFLLKLGNQQQDADEFFGNFLNSIIETEICNNNDKIEDCCMDFYKLFYAINSSTVTCPKCQYKSIKMEPVSPILLAISEDKTIDINIKNAISEDETIDINIKNAMEKYLENEHVENQPLTCGNCNETNDLYDKKLDFIKLPTVLIILLKRYKRENKDSSRIKSKFDMNASSKLDLTINYDLYATANHQGDTGGGHYYAWIKNSNNWSEFNDSKYGDSVIFDENNQKGPYVLFYKTQSTDLQIDYIDIFIKSVNSNKTFVSDIFINDVYSKMTIFSKDSFDRTPLFYAAQSSVRDNSEIILKLIDEKKCNINKQDNVNQETPLQIAMKNATDNSFMNIVTMLNHDTFTESMINPASSSPVKSLTDIFTKLDNDIQNKIQNAILKKETKQKFMPATTTATATAKPVTTATTTTTATSTTTSLLPHPPPRKPLLPLPPPPPSTKTAPPIQCPIIIKFSNDKKDVEVVDMDVDSSKCAGIARLPFDSTQIVDGTQYLTFVTFDQDDLFVTGVDFAIQNSAKCDYNLQKILDDVVNSGGISSVSATAALGGSGGAVVSVSSGGTPTTSAATTSASTSAATTVASTSAATTAATTPTTTTAATTAATTTTTTTTPTTTAATTTTTTTTTALGDGGGGLGGSVIVGVTGSSGAAKSKEPNSYCTKTPSDMKISEFVQAKSVSVMRDILDDPNYKFILDDPDAADRFWSDFTCLMYQARNGDIDRVKYLLFRFGRKGIDPDGKLDLNKMNAPDKNKHQFNAILCATLALNKDIIELLLIAGADPNIECGVFGRPFDYFNKKMPNKQNINLLSEEEKNVVNSVDSLINSNEGRDDAKYNAMKTIWEEKEKTVIKTRNEYKIQSAAAAANANAGSGGSGGGNLNKRIKLPSAVKHLNN